MTFTALHKALGRPPGPITAELVEAAVDQHVEETTDLDWKKPEALPRSNLVDHDYPKDVAAMANSGGGVLAYGVSEDQKAARQFVDFGVLDEAHERTLHDAAVQLIHPPVFGLTVHRVTCRDSNRVVVVEVPASLDTPHMIYRQKRYFGVPVRNNAATVWALEREVEQMYRARFNERRNTTDELDALYAGALAGVDTAERAWMVVVARPRIPRVTRRMTWQDAREVLEKGGQEALALVPRGRGPHPLENVDLLNPRPGLRSWVARCTAKPGFGHARLVVHSNGSVSMIVAVGGPRTSHDESAEVNELSEFHFECCITDTMGIVRAAAAAAAISEYHVRVGVEWSGRSPITILRHDPAINNFLTDAGTSPVPRYTSVDASINARASANEFRRSVYDLLVDCVNQGGINEPRLLRPSADA